MSLFRPIKETLLPTAQNNVLGGSCEFELTREYPIDQMYLVVNVTCSGAAATPSADGLFGLVKKIQLTGQDNGVNRMIVDASGATLVELGYHTNDGRLDRNTRGRINSASVAATSYELIVPINCCHPQFPDPVGSMLLLPVDRYSSNPKLSITWGAQADVDVNGAPTFAISALTARLRVVRRIVDRLNWPILNWEIFEQTVNDATGGGDNLMTDIPLGGNYTGILMRCQTSTSARGDYSAGDWDVRLNTQVLDKFTLLDKQRENDYSAEIGTGTTDSMNGSYYLDFVNDRLGGTNDTRSCFGSLLNANFLVNSGLALRIRRNVNAAAGRKTTFAFHRIHGILDALKYK
ncbi:MAG TPA: hypothetical protein VGH19_16085 [Verrucomicrobiae bacterium]